MSNTGSKHLGELEPIGGGDNIPLARAKLVVGRRSGSDICLQFPNISSNHCELVLENGYWKVVDLKSRNGVKVNGVRYSEKFLMPGDKLHIADRCFVVNYDPQGAEPPEETQDEVFSVSLMEKAGLERKPNAPRRSENLASELPAPKPESLKAPTSKKKYDGDDEVMKWLLGDD